MIYDITPTITPQLAVWPGDTPPMRQVLLDLARGDNLTLSALHATVHLGAHADAPSHYGAGAPSIEGRSLESTLVLQVHDELVLECPQPEIEVVSALTKELMEGVVKLEVPLTVDMAIGASLADVKD